MIFPETGRGAGGAGGEEGAEGQGKVAAVPAPLLRHRVTARPSVSSCLFFFCSALRVRAELSHLNGIILGSFLSQTSLLCRAPELSSISSKLREALVR